MDVLRLDARYSPRANGVLFMLKGLIKRFNVSTTRGGLRPGQQGSDAVSIFKSIGI